MKKTILLVLVLCLAFISAYATDGYLTDGSPVEFEGFTLTHEEGGFYVMGERTVGGMYVMLYPYFSHKEGDATANITFVWYGEQDFGTVEKARDDMENTKLKIKSEIAQMGASVESVEMTEPGEILVAGVPCISYDVHIVAFLEDQQIETWQRIYAAGEKEYIITSCAGSHESIEALDILLNDILVWQ